MIKKLKYLFLIVIPTISFAEQVTININAQVLDRTCTLSSNGIEVTMPIGDIRGKSINSSFSKTPFSIGISDCPANISTAHVKFNSTSDINNPKLIKNMEGEGYASGIALGLFNSHGSLIDINSNQIDFLIDHSSVNNEIKFSVAYFKTSESASSGRVLGVAEFEINYD